MPIGDGDWLDGEMWSLWGDVKILCFDKDFSWQVYVIRLMEL